MDPKQLRNQADECVAQAQEIRDKADEEARSMTQEEADKCDTLCREAERLLQEAERRERIDAVASKLEQPAERKSEPVISDGGRIEVPGGLKLFRFGQLRAFKGAKAEAHAYRTGRFLAAVLFNHQPSREWCRQHGVAIQRDQEFPETRAMAEGINASGGFLVPDEFEQTIIDLREEYGMARQYCRIKPMASDHANEPKKTGGLTAYPVGENAELTESEQTWGNVELTAKKWAVLTRISSELTEDSLIDLADDLAQDAALAFATAEDNACIDGDGGSDYHGITGIRPLMIDGSHTGSYYDASSSCDEWSEITDAILLSVMARVPKYARRGSAWHCSPLAKVKVFDRLLRAAGGNTVANLAAGAPATYNGYPIAEWPSMPEDDTSAALNNKIMLLFGNMTMSSKLGTRRGITVLRLNERYAEYDQIGIRFTERYTIVHHSITDRADSTAKGPICGLMGGT